MADQAALHGRGDVDAALLPADFSSEDYAPDTVHMPTIPQATLSRLTTYLHVLSRVSGGIISSEELAALAGVNSANLRKDLSHLGTYGTRGVGYEVSTLTDMLRGVLGAHEEYPVVIVGVGHLGSALAGYPGFTSRGFPVRVLLDDDPAKIGTVVAGVAVSSIGAAAELCRAHDIAIGVIATPEAVAQGVADVLITAGVRSILNFSPGPLTVPDGVEVRRVDLASELQLLAFHESRRERVTADLAGGSAT